VANCGLVRRPRAFPSVLAARHDLTTGNSLAMIWQQPHCGREYLTCGLKPGQGETDKTEGKPRLSCDALANAGPALLSHSAFPCALARVPHFLETGNLKEIATQASVVAILACGQTAVIITGNIDLSIAAVMAFAGVAAADAMKYHGVNMWGGILIACVCGTGMGAVSGLITGYGAIPSFIVTLG